MALIAKGANYLTRRAKKAQHQIKAVRLHKETVRLVKPNLPMKAQPLTQAAKEELQKELFRPDSFVRPEDVTEVVDTSLESFFNKREYSKDNFDKLLMLLGQRGQLEESLSILDKMRLMEIEPTNSSYLQVMVAAARSGDIRTAEMLFKGVNPNPYLYSTLMSAYVKSGKYETIYKLIEEKRLNGFEITPIDYTLYFNALVKADEIELCIKEYERVCIEFPPDEFMLIQIITACGKRSMAEYALRRWAELQAIGFTDIAYPYNEMIITLAKRKDYADQALEMYQQMQAKGILPDARTFQGVILACARLGDIYTARAACYDMSQLDIPLNQSKYGLLMEVYANAYEHTKEVTKDSYIEDAWELFKQYKEQGFKVNTLILNNLLSVHTKAHRNDQVEGLVIPLYEENNVQIDSHTYRHLIKMYSDIENHSKVFELWEQMQEQQIKPDMYIMNSVLKMAMKFDNIEHIILVLEKFKENGLQPLYYYVKRLSEIPNCPDRIILALQAFPSQVLNKINRRYKKHYKPESEREKFTFDK